MIKYKFTLLLVGLLLTANMFAQKDIPTQPKTITVEKQEPQAIIRQKETPKVTPLYEQVTKNTPTSKTAKTKAVPSSQPLFKSASRPSIYKNLDARICDVEAKVEALKAEPNHSVTTRIKYEKLLGKLRKIKAETPNNQ